MSTNIVPSNYVRFDSEGLELIVDTSTGKAYASISATARMLETNKGTISDAIAKGVGDCTVVNAEIQTAGGLQGVRLVPAFVVYKLAQKYHPLLADRMGEAGANVYMLGLAGYKVAIESPKVPQTYAEALLEAGRLQLEVERQAAQIEANKPLVEYAEAVQHSDTAIEFIEFAKMMGTGRTRLFRAMREAGVILKNSTLPYQNWCDAGYFEVSQEITEDGKLVPFALVTGKGQIWLKQRLYQSVSNQQKMINAIADSVAQMSLL